MTIIAAVGDKITFNTGRGYTSQGQIINAEVLAVEPCDIVDGDFNYRVLMEDTSRRIRYVFLLWDFTERAIMTAYDSGQGQPADSYILAMSAVSHRDGPHFDMGRG